jgi:hypothetical protein
MFKASTFFTALLPLFICLLSCGNKDTQFEKLSSSKTNIDFENKLPKRELLNILYYLYYYNGGGVATGDVNGDGLPDIYFTSNNKGANKLYINRGNFEFEDVTAKAGVAGTADWCSGVTMADVNSDGLLDIYVSSVAGSYGLTGHNQLFINNGVRGTAKEVSFTESSAQYGLNFSGLSTQAAFFDYDHDGDLDCYLVNHSKQPHANIVDTVHRRKYNAQSGDVLFRNELDGPSKKFIDVSASSGIYQSNLGYGLGLAVADFNNDGWEDIYVGNDFHENDYYYINQKNGTFTESGARHFGHYSRFSMGNDAADYNNDGQMDLITVDMLPDEEKVLKTYGSDENPDIYKVKLQLNGYQHQYSRNCLQQNNGDGVSFSEVGLLNGVSATDWSWCPLFADFDNDGYKDLFISSGIVKRPVDLDYVRFVSDMQMNKGLDKTDKYDEAALKEMPDGASHPFFFQGSGQNGFIDRSEDWGTAGMDGYYTGASYADLDNDGALDLVMNCIDAPAVVMRNKGPKKNHISFSFRGDSLNTHGVGAKVYLYKNGALQYQQLMQTRGFQSASDARLHFGLDSLKVLDSVRVVWPDASYQVMKNVAVNKNLIIHKKDAGGTFDYASMLKPEAQVLQLVEGISPAWKHREDDFVDYNVQYLIPHAQSTRGPKIAAGDVNGDGRDDFYVCGAHGQAGLLMVQGADGSFSASANPVFAADARSEDVDALFFDANGDAFPDLYVVSGGNKVAGQDSSLLDRLYINNGKGQFTRSNGLPAIYGHKSCVTAGDIDGDKDADLFVGTLADPHAYGVPQTSHLLINDGTGRFSVAGQQVMALANIGLVTSSSFADVNRDGLPDLVVAGEWMPITIFINRKGSFEKTELPHSTGWWQTLLVDDVNGDGAVDILAGNWGHNNKFTSCKNGPVRMYVSDFDKNGRTDQLLSYTADGKEYPFLAKDEVERSLPVLKKHYLKYGEYAGLEMKDAFYGFVETVNPLQAERMGSAVCFGNGKGQFTLSDLPPDLQKAPVFSFSKVGTGGGGTRYLAGGNFFETIPYEGRYDAQALALFTIKKNNEVSCMVQKDLASVSGQVRDIERLNSGRFGSVLVVAENNSGLSFYSTKNN